MTGIAQAYIGARIFDGEAWFDDHALVLRNNGDLDILSADMVPTDCPQETLDGGIILPGFVDLQVNGGGGVMFNDDQCVEALHTIAKAHASTGTAAILPTLITDTPERTALAISAVEQAIAQRIDGIAGIHLEGPHLSVARKGAHDPNLIRAMSDEDLAIIVSAAERIPNVKTTVAPENVTHAQIRKMADAGVIVSLGHTNADFETCMAAFEAGARCVTHLFNAMSQFASRDPGLVGTALMRDDIYAGLIADGIHVHPAAIKMALAARGNSARIFLVSDAMATVGSDIESFLLNGRHVHRHNHRLTLEDDTLAGADLEMRRALGVMEKDVGEGLEMAIPRATATPASLLREQGNLGRITPTTRRVCYLRDGICAPMLLGSVE